MSAPLTPLVPAPPRKDAEFWVSAAPFRSHLRHLCNETGLPWPVVALSAGLSVRHANALLHGREGRPVRRLPRPIALRLWCITAADLATLRRTRYPADVTGRRINVLLNAGFGFGRLAAELRWSPVRLANLLDDPSGSVTAEDALRVLALLETIDRRHACCGTIWTAAAHDCAA